MVPRGPSSFREVEQDGYRNLVEACRKEGIGRFVLMSVPVLPEDARIPTFRTKREIERRVAESGLTHTVFRGSLFMDDWFALMGSSVPLRGAEAHTLRRPFWFARMFLGAVGHAIDRHGVALVPGSGKARHAFIAVDDVADFLFAATAPDAPTGTLEIGGPEVLSWDDVVALFAKVFGRPVRALKTPAGAYSALAAALGPFSPAASNLMAMSWALAIEDTPYDTRETAGRFGVRLTSAEEFLRKRAAMPD